MGIWIEIGVLTVEQLHLAVVKRPAHAGTQRRIGDDPRHCLVDEQVEQGVVGGGHPASQIRFDNGGWRRNGSGWGRDWRYESPRQGQKVIV